MPRLNEEGVVFRVIVVGDAVTCSHGIEEVTDTDFVCGCRRRKIT